MPGNFVLPRHGDVLVNPVNDHTLYDLAMAPFRAKHAELGGAPGQPLSQSLPENHGSGSRVRYQNGTLYQRADGSVAWVYGKIGERYDQLGAGTGWLGMPVTDELDFTEAGRANRFDNGSIYFWPDTGAIDVNEVIVHYTGLYAFAETDSDGVVTSADEPYVVLGVVAPSASTSTRSQIYADVDAGDSRPDLIELYRGQPEGMAISVALMEHDDGDPDKYKAAVTAAVTSASAAVTAGVALVPGGVFVAPWVAAALLAVGPDIVDAVNELLGTGDDALGNTVVHLSAKQMIVLAARTLNRDQWGIGWKAESPELTGQGSDYKVYFGLVTA
jgi:hypothetical protein